MRTIRVIGEKGSEIMWQEGKLSGDEYLVNHILALDAIATENGGTAVEHFEWVDSPCLKHDRVAMMWIQRAFRKKKERIEKTEMTPAPNDPSWTHYQIDFNRVT